MKGRYPKVDFETVDPKDPETYYKYQGMYGVQYVPAVIVLDSTGNELLRQYYSTEEAALEKNIENALDKASLQP